METRRSEPLPSICPVVYFWNQSSGFPSLHDAGLGNRFFLVGRFCAIGTPNCLFKRADFSTKTRLSFVLRLFPIATSDNKFYLLRARPLRWVACSATPRQRCPAPAGLWACIGGLGQALRAHFGLRRRRLQPKRQGKTRVGRNDFLKLFTPTILNKVELNGHIP